MLEWTPKKRKLALAKWISTSFTNVAKTNHEAWFKSRLSKNVFKLSLHQSRSSLQLGSLQRVAISTFKLWKSSIINHSLHLNVVLHLLHHPQLDFHDIHFLSCLVRHFFMNWRSSSKNETRSYWMWMKLWDQQLQSYFKSTCSSIYLLSVLNLYAKKEYEGDFNSHWGFGNTIWKVTFRNIIQHNFQNYCNCFCDLSISHLSTKTLIHT